MERQAGSTAARRRPPRRGFRRAAGSFLLGLLVIGIVWQASIWLLSPAPYILPSPAAVFSTLVERADFLARHGVVTLSEIAFGLLFGTAAGMAVALGVAAIPGVAQIVWPAVLVIQALPVFAIAPILVLWFGFGMASKVVMAALIIFFPVASAFADGLRRTDREVVESAALLGASKARTLFRIRIPLALPGLVSGLRVAAPLAPLGAVIGEWVGASAGLGFIMLQANARMQTDIMFAVLVVLAALTLALRFAADELADILVPWARED